MSYLGRRGGFTFACFACTALIVCGAALAAGRVGVGSGRHASDPARCAAVHPHRRCYVTVRPASTGKGRTIRPPAAADGPAPALGPATAAPAAPPATGNPSAPTPTPPIVAPGEPADGGQGTSGSGPGEEAPGAEDPKTEAPPPGSPEEPEPEAPEAEQPEAPKPPAPFFQGAFKSGFPGWYVQSLPERVTLNSTNPFKGQQAARFEVRVGDREPDTGSQRSEVSGPTFAAGESIYVRDAIRIPRAYAFHGPWQLIDQLHETEWGGSPGIAFFLDEGRNLSMSAGDGDPHYWRGPQLEYDRWYEVVYHVYLSRDPRAGYVEVWLNGKQQTLDNGATKQFGETIQTGHTYLKTGIYRSTSSTGTSVVEHAGVAVSHSLSSFLGS